MMSLRKRRRQQHLPRQSKRWRMTGGKTTEHSKMLPDLPQHHAKKKAQKDRRSSKTGTNSSASAGKTENMIPTDSKGDETIVAYGRSSKTGTNSSASVGKTENMIPTDSKGDETIVASAIYPSNFPTFAKAFQEDKWHIGKKDENGDYLLYVKNTTNSGDRTGTHNARAFYTPDPLETAVGGKSYKLFRTFIMRRGSNGCFQLPEEDLFGCLLGVEDNTVKASIIYPLDPNIPTFEEAYLLGTWHVGVKNEYGDYLLYGTNSKDRITGAYEIRWRDTHDGKSFYARDPSKTTVKIYGEAVKVLVQGEWHKEFKTFTMCRASNGWYKLPDGLFDGLSSKCCKKTDMRKTDRLRNKRNFASQMLEPAAEWKVQDSEKGATSFGGRVVTEVRLARESAAPDNFLAQLFGNRLMRMVVPLNKEEFEEPINATCDDDIGCRYELVSSKVQSDGESGSMRQRHIVKKKCLHLMYVKVRGPQLTEISLPDELLRIANFSRLTERKICARLELLMSTAHVFENGKKAMFSLNSSDFVTLSKPNGHDGCGFIAEDFLEYLLGEKAVAKRTVSLQMRAIIPSMGIFKGMLFRKRITSGPPVQLDPTQLKVGPSPTGPDDHRAFLLIVTSGLEPNGTNQRTGNLLDPSKKSPEKSLEWPKPLSHMIPRLWDALGVPEKVCKKYVKKSKEPTHLNHAWVRGVADPTGCIPDGHVFFTGMKGKVATVDKLFVTRSPCVKVEDGRIVPQLVKQPEGMAPEDWDWLTGLAFGAIVFGNPKNGMQPLPARIANGDLDGDSYFVCWNKAILESLSDCNCDYDGVQAGEKKGSKSKRRHVSNNWFSNAQQSMVHEEKLEIDALIRKLHSMFKKTANESEYTIKDKDAIAFADAYIQSIDYEKNGNKIRLPQRLIEKLPERFQKYCRPTS